MDDLNPMAAKGARKMAQDLRRIYGPRIEQLVHIGAPRELVGYLVGPETRVAQLEQRLPMNR